MKKVMLAAFCTIGLIACSAAPNTNNAVEQNNTCSCRKQNAQAECGCEKCKSHDMKNCECGAGSSSHHHNGHCSAKH